MTLRFTGGISTSGEITANPQFSSAPTDEFFSSVTLLMHMEDATDVIGNSTSNTGVTFAAGQFNNAGVFDGNDWIDITPSSGFDLSASDFTAECWFNTSTGTGFHEMLSSWAYSINERSWLIWVNAGNLFVNLSDDGTLNNFISIGGTSVSDGNWHHVALVRSGSDYDLFLDGTLNDSENGYGNIFAGTNLTIGAPPIVFDENFIGSIDDVRITKGVARYTANFDIPTEEFPNS